MKKELAFDIYGPRQSGKTTQLIEFVNSYTKEHENKKILIAAPSWAQVANLVIDIKENGNKVHISYPSTTFVTMFHGMLFDLIAIDNLDKIRENQNYFAALEPLCNFPSTIVVTTQEIPKGK